MSNLTADRRPVGLLILVVGTMVIALFLALSLAVPAGATNAMPGDLDGDAGHLNFDEAQALALWLDGLADEAGDPPGEPRPADLINWAAALLPIYQREGATDETHIPPNITFGWWAEGAAFSFVAGRSNCGSYAVVSARAANPADVWHSRLNYVAVLAHELAHVQQGHVCLVTARTKIENSAEIISWEVLAALANDGNLPAARALLHELRGRAMGAAHATAIEEDRLPEYEALVATVSPGAARAAAHARSDRWWSERPDELATMLDRYSRGPWQQVLQALAGDGQLEVHTRPGGRTLMAIDDLAYFLDHAAEILADLNAEAQK